ncbi:hypothetical protein Zmor_010582 [Zophobas morio]|uniref:Uncharacterized protein n=1 Tax=Zophobas morio TaxID=2755281 RepID=A0AA38MIX9_9CUCU|nr:hypothetical protein Zmor_010582 [Zophobas morio]
MSCSLGHCTSALQLFFVGWRDATSISAPNGPVLTRSAKVPCRWYWYYLEPFAINNARSTNPRGKKLCGSRAILLFLFISAWATLVSPVRRPLAQWRGGGGAAGWYQARWTAAARGPPVAAGAAAFEENPKIYLHFREMYE